MKAVWVISLLIFSYLKSNTQVLYSENFETNSGYNSWTSFNESPSSYWNWGNAIESSSNHWKIPSHSLFISSNDDKCNCDKSKDIIKSPKIFIENIDTLLVKIDVFYNAGYYDGIQEKAIIFIEFDYDTLYVDTLQGSNEWRTLMYPVYNLTNSDSMSIGIKYSDQGGWMFGLAFDNVSVLKYNSFDLEISDIEVPKLIAMGDPLDIFLRIFNHSMDTMSNVSIFFQYVDTVVEQKLTSKLLPFSINQYTFNDVFLVSDTINNTIKIWLSDSLILDTQDYNDTLQTHFFILKYPNPKNTLIETFVSNSCIPCISAQYNFYQQLNPLGVNTENGNIFNINYHANNSLYPADSAYILENEIRRNYYNLMNLSEYTTNGEFNYKNLNYFNASEITEKQNAHSYLEITNDYSIINDTITIDVQLFSHIKTPAHFLKLHTLILENEMVLYDASESSLWRNAVRIFATPPVGLTFTDTLYKNSTYSYQFKEEIKQSSIISYNSGAFSSTNNNIAVISFVQDDLTHEIVQVSGLRWPQTSENLSNSYVQQYSIYPNPTRNILYIAPNTPNIQSVSIKLFSLSGQLLYSNIAYNLHETISLDPKQPLEGFYILQISDNQNKIYTTPVLFIK